MNPEIILLVVLIALALGLVGGYYLRARLPARRWLARRGLAWRSADTAADDADDQVEEAFAPLAIDMRLPPELRLEVAAPEMPTAGRPFDLVVGLIARDDPRSLPEITRTAKDTDEPPLLGALRFRVSLESAGGAVPSGFTVSGPTEKTAVWWPDGPPALLVFRLVADGGQAVVRLFVHQGLREAGRARLRLDVVPPTDESPSRDGGSLGGAGRVSGWALYRSTITVHAPQAAEHLLAHAFAETHAPEELAALADELGAPEPPAGASPFIVAMDLVTHAARNGEADELAARLMATHPNWRAALRDNPRAQRLVNFDRSTRV